MSARAYDHQHRPVASGYARGVEDRLPIGWRDQSSKSDAEIGYLHRCFEKMAETHQWNGVIPYTDRLNYCSSFLNNVGYACTVEKLLGIEVPKRVQYIRVLLGELSRIMDHMVCLGAALVDLGAITNFWYSFEPREEIYDLLEMTSGQRMMVSYVRVGGLSADLPDDFVPRCREVLGACPDTSTICTSSTQTAGSSSSALLVCRRFPARTRSIGDSRDRCCARRACRMTFARIILIRATRISISKCRSGIAAMCTIDTWFAWKRCGRAFASCEQALDNLPEGPYQVDDRRITLPPKKGVYTNIEDLMNHFKLVMHGIQAPPGEVYGYSEGGERRAWVLHCERRFAAAVASACARPVLPDLLGVSEDDRRRTGGGCNRDVEQLEHHCGRA